MTSAPSLSRLGDIPSGSAVSLSSIPDDPCFHIAPFHSFQRVYTSSRSLVYRALRHPSSPPSSSTSASPASPSASLLPASSSVPSSALYAACTPDSPFALKYLIQWRDGAFRPVVRAQLSLFSQQYELLCQMRDKGVQGVIRPFELIGVQLPLQLPSASLLASSTSSAHAASSASSASTSSSTGSAQNSIVAASSSTSNSHLSNSAALHVYASYSTLCLVHRVRLPGTALSTFYSKPRYSVRLPTARILSRRPVHPRHRRLHPRRSHTAQGPHAQQRAVRPQHARSTRIIDFGLSEMQLVDGGNKGVHERRGGGLCGHVGVRQSGADRACEPRCGCPQRSVQCGRAAVSDADRSTAVREL